MIDSASQAHSSVPALHVWSWGAALVIVLLTIAAYWNSFSGELVLDDQMSISDNASIRRLSDVATVLSPPAYSTVGGRPVANLSFALNYAIGGTRVRGYHVANLAIHLAAALLLFGIVRRTLIHAAAMEREDRKSVV